MALLKWCWEHRDAARYRELFTSDFHFVTASAPDSVWSRDEELNAAAALFGAGVPEQAGATSVALEFEGDPQPGTAFLPGKPYPWHQQILVPGLSLRIDRSDGSTLVASGRTLFHLVRGDYASIPQELRDRGFLPDSTRWYVERWEDAPESSMVVDHEPVVSTSPRSAGVQIEREVAIEVTAMDPDGDAITNLVYEGPTNVTFVQAPDHRSARLTWVPGVGDTGHHALRFTASNRLTSSILTTVDVTAPSQPPAAALAVSPTQGSGPLRVTLDASGSRDPDGTIVSYRFSLGDGNVVTRTTPVIVHTYPTGTYRPSVVVVDDTGLTSRLEGAAVTVGPTATLTAVLNASPLTGKAPLHVSFDGSSSRDLAGTISSYRMNYGDGSTIETKSTSTFTHTYAAGSWTAILTVLNGAGQTSSASQVISAAPPADTSPPVVTAPPQVTSDPGRSIDFTVTAFDPDGEGIASLTASGMPASATFAVTADRRAGAFSWFATTGDTGTRIVTFTASNSQSVSAQTAITVAENRSPEGTLVATPAAGTEPLIVRLDASSFHDSDGISSYRFYTGDGAIVSQTSPVLVHTYGGGRWNAAVTVTDRRDRSTTATCTVDVSPPAAVVGAFEAVEELATAWRARDSAACRRLLTEDFRFTFAPWDTAGDALTGRSWDRDAELAVVDRMFSGAYPQIQLSFEEPLTLGTSFVPGRTYPWHVQILAPRLVLVVDRDGVRQFEARGQALFSVVRGDSARISGGSAPDPSRWFVESWQDWTGDRPSGNVAPQASLMFSRGSLPQQAILDASRSRDEDGTIVRYRFDFGDGAAVTQSSPVVSHVYAPGRWTAWVTLTDNGGHQSSASAVFTVATDRPPAVTAPATVQVRLGQEIAFSVTAMDPDGEAITTLTGVIPAAATFTSSTDNRQGGFRWTPADTGRFTARFTATNRLSTTVETIILVVPDLPPVITAPASVQVRLGQEVSFSVSTADPDSQPIASFTAAGPPGSTFAASADNRQGTFTWTPPDTGRYTVRFTASNALVGIWETTLLIRSSNEPPTAALTASPNGGVEPQIVRLDASASRDPDGGIVTYQFDFGDGTAMTATAPILTHTYMAGRWDVRVTVADADGATATASYLLEVLPSPSFVGAKQAVESFAAAWRNRDPIACRDLLADDFRFTFAPWDTAGDDLPGRGWNRDEELLVIGRMFGSGFGDQPPAPAVELTFDETPIVGHAPGRSYPWHLQVLVPRLTLSVLLFEPKGAALFSLVRGDSARLPQELIDLGVRPDSTRWYIEGWQDWTGEAPTTTNQPPTAALSLTPAAGIAPMTVRLDASRSRDDDGTIVSFRFDFGDGTSIMQASPIALHTYGDGHWTATVSAFDNRNAASNASISLTVLAPGTQPNLARNPSFEIDGRFWNSYAGATLERVVGEGHDGNVGLKITGPAAVNGSFGVNDSPDQVRWTLGPGIRYRYTAWVRSPSSRGTARLKIREYLISTGAKLGEAASAGVQLSPEWQMLTLDYVTSAANATLDFQVRDWPVAPSEVFFTDDIAIRNVSEPGAGTGMASWYKGEDPIAMQPRLVPSPIRHAGTLSFMTSQPGVLRVEILDLAGRRMGKLMDEREAPAGLYEFTIGPDGRDGLRLKAGVYFYRVEAREGVRSGRFVMLP